MMSGIAPSREAPKDDSDGSVFNRESNMKHKVRSLLLDWTNEGVVDGAALNIIRGA
jgi:hypothetical protein